MSVQNMCRLCLAKNNLLWVFDEKNENIEMRDIIYFSTGIEIHINDIISQKICENCYQFTVKMFQFRNQCINSEKYLKDQCKECFKKDAQFNIPNTQVTITNAVTQHFKKVIKPSYLIHPSVTELSKTYPQIKLPPLCLKSHIAPVVSMEMDEVESYFKRRKLDINVYIKSAFKSSRKFEKLNQTNIITKSNPGMKTLIETENKNSVIKSNKKAKLVNAKRSVQLDTVKQRLKKNIGTSVNKIPLTTRPLTKSQNISPSKVKRKRNLLGIPTKRKAKKLSGNDLLDLTSMLEDTTKIKVNEESIFKESLNLTPKSTVCSLTKHKFSDSLSKVRDLNIQINKKQKMSAHTLNKNGYFNSFSYIDKSVPLHICNVCNSVQYSTKHLRKHQIDHLCCQFCKIRFRTLQKKIYHVENLCVFKKTMTNMPDVKLKKIEYDREIRHNYPEAFVDFTPFENEDNSDITNRENVTDEVEPVRTDLAPFANEDNSDITNRDNVTDEIELVRTDLTPFENEDNSDITNRDNFTDEVEPVRTDLTQNIKTILKSFNNELNNQSITDDTNVPSEHLDIIEIVSDNEEPPIITSSWNHNETIPNKSSAINQLSTGQNVQNGKFPLLIVKEIVLRPRISIKNNRILNDIDVKNSDEEIMKTLLTVSQRMKSFKQKYTQTDLPSNKDIIKFKEKVILKNLKQHLWTCKIPITKKFGKMNVSYDYTNSSKQPNKLCLWNDLIPIDIKETKDLSSMELEKTCKSHNTIALHSHYCSLESLDINEISTGSTIKDCHQAESNATKQTKFPSVTLLSENINREALISSSEVIQEKNDEVIYFITS